MDKYDLVLDIIEHPEKYSSEQLAEIMSESETKDIYNLLCKTDSAVEAYKDPDINAEWKIFSDKNKVRLHRTFLCPGSRAASIAAIIGTSIIAVAAGIVATVAVIDHRQKPIGDHATVASSVIANPTEKITIQNDTVKFGADAIMFEDESIENIMKDVADAYGIEVKFNNNETASLHLYYKFDPSLPLNEVVEQLNTFERIKIERNGNILIIN